MNCTFEMVNELHIYSIFWIVCRMIIKGRMGREIFMYIKKILSKIIYFRIYQVSIVWIMLIHLNKYCDVVVTKQIFIV